MAVIFQPTLLEWLFGSGIGTNIGAALVWVPIGALLGFVWSKTSYWPLHTIHVHMRAIEASTISMHDKLNAHARHHAAHAAALERIEAKLDEPRSR